MKKLKKVLLILVIVFVLFSAVAYVDYFVVVKRTTFPKIALKENINSDLVVYKSIFYKVWYCKLNDTYTIGDYSDKDAICDNTLKYDKEGNYTNALNVKIDSENMKLISNFYSYEDISKMSEEEVKDSLYVIENAYKVNFKYYLDSDGDKQETHSGYYLIQFPKYKLNGDDVEWIYEDKYYCINENNEIAEYDESMECGTFTSIGLEKKWCELYKKSKFSENKQAKKLCGE